MGYFLNLGYNYPIYHYVNYSSYRNDFAREINKKLEILNKKYKYEMEIINYEFKI